MSKVWHTDEVRMLAPSGAMSNELELKLRELDRAGRSIFQIIQLPNTYSVVVVSFERS